MLGAGSALIGKSLKTEILREEALELALEGFLPFYRARRGAQGREAQPVPRAGPAVRFRPRHHAPPERVPGADGRRRPTPSCSTAASSFRRSCASAWPTWWASGTAGGRRFWKTPSSIWRWRAARRITPTCAPPAAACWCAAACRGPITSGWANRARASSRRCAWCRAAPKKARPSKSITTRCNWWPTARCPSACTAR